MSGKESLISGSHKGKQIRPVSEKTGPYQWYYKLKCPLIGYSLFNGTQSKVNKVKKKKFFKKAQKSE